ncbi:MAG: CBS domain-containing protein [Holosporaceae bacterium]|jgi:CBS domain containing-hemolysin-like protein|nr:CBS domain-containing protein [Holosporaceae bacterium]
MYHKIKNYFKGLIKKKEQELPLIDRLEDLIESEHFMSSDQESDDNSELALVSNVLGLKDLTAADIMVPRADIVAAKIDTSLEEFIEIFSKNHFSQIPIYRNTLDDVVGIVMVRDFLPYVKNPESFNITSLLKEVIYVVPSIQLLELLLEIRLSANHMVLVVDEFGGVDGLVTLQDVVSEIVGEIQQSRGIFPQIITRQDGSFLADAKMLVSECEDILGVNLLKPFLKEGEEPDIETLGGLTMLLAERMPTRGETLQHPSGIEFEIADADLRRVKRIIMRKSPSLSSDSSVAAAK